MNKKSDKPIPYLSLFSAIGFAVCVFVLALIEAVHGPESTLAAQRTRLLGVMLCLLFAGWASIVSLITAWCPIILGGDRRPWFWVLPLVLAWLLLVQLFDWPSLVPHESR